MDLYALEPEVAGGFGSGTVIGTGSWSSVAGANAPVVEVLDYRLDGWMEDDIITFLSIFAVTPRLARAMREDSLSGFVLREMSVSKSEMWEQMGTQMEVPAFQWLVPTGKVTLSMEGSVISWSGHDVCWGDRVDWSRSAGSSGGKSPFSLVVSQRALSTLRGVNLNFCSVEPLT